MYSPLGALGGLINLGCTFFWILLLAVVVLFLVKIFSVNKYDEESVIERWGAVLPGQADMASTYLDKVDDALRARMLTFASRRERIAISLTSGETYDFLVCEMNADYSCFVSFVPIGADLEVSWLVQDHMIRGVYRVPILGPLLLSVMKRYTFANGNKIRAFASATHSCAVEAAERIMDEANVDKSRLNRKTSGRLGPL